MPPLTVLLVEVTNNGPGISGEGLAHAFERFWRADRWGTACGVCLGLAIARWIIELHGGTIGAA